MSDLILKKYEVEKIWSVYKTLFITIQNSSLYTLHFKFYTLHFTLYSFQFSFYTYFALYTLHFTLTFYTLKL